jgi:serine/threonine-protein kinase
MGVVVAARHLHLEQRVAIKLLLPEAAKDEGAVARFLREGRAASSIRSEHVVRVHDVDVFAPWGPALVLELLDGHDLDALVQAGPAPIAVAVDYVLQACEALAEAHALGIVHRDLKPQNLFLTHRADGTPCIKVLDFGISKIKTQATDHRLTSTGMIFGTPSYMAPEQMRESRDTDARTDIWAIGAILFELCAGKPPFSAESLTELTAKVLMDPAPRLRSLRADAPKELEAAVARCLEKEPAQRFLDVGELAHAIAGCGSAQARASAERIAGVLGRAGKAVAPPSKVNPLAQTTPAATLAPSTTSPLRGRRRSSLLPGVGVALGLAVVGSLAWFALRRGTHTAPVAVAPATTSVAATSDPAPPAPRPSASPSVAPAETAAVAPAESAATPAVPSGYPPAKGGKWRTPPKASASSAPAAPPKPDGIARDRDG